MSAPTGLTTTSVRVYAAEDFAAKPSSTQSNIAALDPGNDCSAAIQQALDAAHAAGGGIVYIGRPGTYWIGRAARDNTGAPSYAAHLANNAALIIYDDTALVMTPGAKLKAQCNLNCYLLSNADHVNGNNRIYIEGWFDGNAGDSCDADHLNTPLVAGTIGVNQNGIGVRPTNSVAWYGDGFFFDRVDQLRIGKLRLDNFAKYGMFPLRCTNVDIEEIGGITYSAICQIDGGNTDWHVRKVWGGPVRSLIGLGDNLMACVSNERYYRPDASLSGGNYDGGIDTRGAIKRITIDHIHCLNASKAPHRLTGSSAYAIEDVWVGKITGTMTDGEAVGAIEVIDDNVFIAAYSSNAGLTNCPIRRCGCGRLDVKIGSGALGHAYFGGGGIIDYRIDTLILRNPAINGVAVAPPVAGSGLQKLSIGAITGGAPSGTDENGMYVGSVIKTTQDLNHLTIGDIDVWAGDNAGICFEMGAASGNAGGIKQGSIANCHFRNGAYFVSQSANSTHARLAFGNLYTQSCNYGVFIYGSLHLSAGNWCIDYQGAANGSNDPRSFSKLIQIKAAGAQLRIDCGHATYLYSMTSAADGTGDIPSIYAEDATPTLMLVNGVDFRFPGDKLAGTPKFNDTFVNAQGSGGTWGSGGTLAYGNVRYSGSAWGKFGR